MHYRYFLELNPNIFSEILTSQQNWECAPAFFRNIGLFPNPNRLCKKFCQNFFNKFSDSYKMNHAYRINSPYLNYSKILTKNRSLISDPLADDHSWWFKFCLEMVRSIWAWLLFSWARTWAKCSRMCRWRSVSRFRFKDRYWEV